MESTRPIRLPAATAAARERDEAEIATAIELVARGLAVRVTLAGLRDPAAVGAAGLAMAQAAQVAFSLVRDPETDAISVVIGPLTR